MYHREMATVKLLNMGLDEDFTLITVRARR